YARSVKDPTPAAALAIDRPIIPKHLRLDGEQFGHKGNVPIGKLTVAGCITNRPLRGVNVAVADKVAQELSEFLGDVCGRDKGRPMPMLRFASATEQIASSFDCRGDPVGCICRLAAERAVDSVYTHTRSNGYIFNTWNFDTGRHSQRHIFLCPDIVTHAQRDP